MAKGGIKGPPKRKRVIQASSGSYQLKGDTVLRDILFRAGTGTYILRLQVDVNVNVIP